MKVNISIYFNCFNREKVRSIISSEYRISLNKRRGLE